MSLTRGLITVEATPGKEPGKEERSEKQGNECPEGDLTGGFCPSVWYSGWGFVLGESCPGMFSSGYTLRVAMFMILHAWRFFYLFGVSGSASCSAGDAEDSRSSGRVAWWMNMSHPPQLTTSYRRRRLDSQSLGRWQKEVQSTVKIRVTENNSINLKN